jgi:hypothetical protein
MFENCRVKTSIILVGIIVITIGLATAQPFFTTAPIMHTQSSDSVLTPQAVQRGPPAPMSLTIWGNQDILDHAIKATGMKWVSLPTLVPQNLTLAPIRVKSDSVVTTITAIYTPPGVSTSNNVTGDQVADAGGFSVTYWKQIGGPQANMTKNMEIVSKEFPNSTSLDTINGHQALIFPNEIQINAGNCMGKTNCWLSIDIGSRTLNSTELRPIAESIAILPHD